jgi:hypothetical protein
LSARVFRGFRVPLSINETNEGKYWLAAERLPDNKPEPNLAVTVGRYLATDAR